MVKLRCITKTVQPMGWPLRIYWGEEGWAYMERDIRRLMPDFEIEPAHGMFVHTNAGHMWLHAGVADEDGNYDILTITHECLHATTYVWDAAGGNLHTHEQTEVLAYTHGHITELVLDALEQAHELQNIK